MEQSLRQLTNERYVVGDSLDALESERGEMRIER